MSDNLDHTSEETLFSAAVKMPASELWPRDTQEVAGRGCLIVKLQQNTALARLHPIGMRAFDHVRDHLPERAARIDSRETPPYIRHHLDRETCEPRTFPTIHYAILDAQTGNKLGT